MFKDKNFELTISKSTQCGVLKASPDEIAAADYITPRKRKILWLHVGDELKLDADDCNITMQQVIELVKYKPTFAHTTQSHMMPGKLNRFRLVYVFDQVMHNFEDFNKIVMALMYDVETAIGKNGHEGFMLDRACNGKNRFFLGNSKSNVKYWTSWNIYKPTDIVSVYDDTPKEDILANMEMENFKGKHSKSKSTENIPRTRVHPMKWLYNDLGNQLVKDCMDRDLAPYQIVQKYSNKYKVRFETPLKKLSADYPFIPYQEGYMKIYFRSQWKTDHTGKRVHSIKPFRNGEERHLMLLNQLISVIAMNYDRICYDDLLFHGLCLFSIGYENKNRDGSDCVGEDVFSPQRIKTIVDEAWEANLEYWSEMIKKNQKESEYGFKVNSETCRILGVSKRQLLPLVKWFYTRCVWIERIHLIEQDILMGKTYKELAKILSVKLGEDIKLSTLGTHVREWRKITENMDLGDKNVTKNWKFPFSPSISTQNPIYTTPLNTPNTPFKKENILSKTNNMTPQDLGITEKHFFQLLAFMELYDNNKTNTENYKYMKNQGMKMSESTYKRNKRLMNKMTAAANV